MITGGNSLKIVQVKVFLCSMRTSFQGLQVFPSGKDIMQINADYEILLE